MIVLHRFADLQDGKHIYEAGDNYPRPGLDVTPERLAELASSDNRTGKPLIKAAETPVNAPDSSGEDLSAHAEKPAKKAHRSRQKG